MHMADTFGYLALVLVVASSSMRTMTPLRVLSIGSNLAFISYSIAEGLLPILILHSLLLPINSIRLFQMQRLVRSVKEATLGDLALQGLLPFMARRKLKRGEILFRKKVRAHEMFYVLTGDIQLQGNRQNDPRGHRARRDQHVLAGQSTHRNGDLRQRRRAAGDERGQGQAALFPEPEVRIPSGAAHHEEAAREQRGDGGALRRVAAGGASARMREAARPPIEAKTATANGGKP
jgi:hypothetical protein